MLEQKESFPGLGPGEAPDQIFLPGSGIAKKLLGMCQDMGLEGVVLSKFCEEGDNTRDGIELADYLNKWLGWVEGEKYKVPPSWKHSAQLPFFGEGALPWADLPSLPSPLTLALPSALP